MIKTIEVTAEDIANGRPGSPGECPIALAIKRTFNVALVGVGGMIEMWQREPVLEHRYNAAGVCPACNSQDRIPRMVTMTPDRARAFIAKYDTGTPVEPFTFEIEIPDEFLAELEKVPA
jgi:hypothetical protein